MVYLSIWCANYEFLYVLAIFFAQMMSLYFLKKNLILAQFMRLYIVFNCLLPDMFNFGLIVISLIF